MYSFDDIKFANFSGEIIDDFFFIEEKDFGFSHGYITLNRELKEDEMTDLGKTIYGLNIYNGVTLEHLKVDKLNKKTYLFFSGAIFLPLPLPNTTTNVVFSASTITTVLTEVLKVNTSTVFHFDLNHTYPTLTGEFDLKGNYENKIATIQRIYDFPQIYYYSYGRKTIFIKDYEKRYFSLKNSPTGYFDSATIAEIEAYEPDYIFSEKDVEILEKHFYDLRGNHILFLNNSYEITTESENSEFFKSNYISLPNVVSLDSYYKSTINKWFRAVYYPIIFKITKKHTHLQLGDAILLEGIYGLVDKIERRPSYDIIYMGFPPIMPNLEKERLRSQIKLEIGKE